MSYKLLFLVLAAFAPLSHCNNEKRFLQSRRDQILAKLLDKYGIPEEHKSYQKHIRENVKKLDDPLKRTSRSIHGTNGIQCRYNRWISRRQESCSKDILEDQEEFSTVYPGE